MKMDHQVSATALYRFARGEIDPSLSVLNCVLTFLDLEIAPKRRTVAARKASKPAATREKRPRKRVTG
jgi:hypothetical protein